MDKETEEQRLTEMLEGKVVTECFRHRENELVILFRNGTRLFINADGPLEFSITG